jgi:hypothetical protein
MAVQALIEPGVFDTDGYVAAVRRMITGMSWGGSPRLIEPQARSRLRWRRRVSVWAHLRMRWQ